MTCWHGTVICIFCELYWTSASSGWTSQLCSEGNSSIGTNNTWKSIWHKYCYCEPFQSIISVDEMSDSQCTHFMNSLSTKYLGVLKLGYYSSLIMSRFMKRSFADKSLLVLTLIRFFWNTTSATAGVTDLFCCSCSMSANRSGGTSTFSAMLLLFLVVAIRVGFCDGATTYREIFHCITTEDFPNSAIEEFKTESKVECAAVCSAHVQCKAFRLLPTSDDAQFMCTLHSRTLLSQTCDNYTSTEPGYNDVSIVTILFPK